MANKSFDRLAHDDGLTSQAIPPRRSAQAAQHPYHSRARTAVKQEQRPVRNLNRYPPASPPRVGHYSGTHPEDAPYTTGDEIDGADLGEPDEPPYERLPTSAIRYPTTQSSPKRTRNIYAEPQATRRFARSRRPAMVLVWLVILLVVMLLGWMAFTSFGSWWQTTTDDWSYGRPRTFQIDAVVGHNHDSPAHPSHFLALNLNRQVIIIELPAGDPAKGMTYTLGTLLGEGQDLTPITLSFGQGANGKSEMVVHIDLEEIVFTNTGTKFVSPQQN